MSRNVSSMEKAANKASAETVLHQDDELKKKVQQRLKQDDAQLVMLSDPDCKACTKMKKALRNAINLGVVEVVSTRSEEGKALMEQLQIAMTPAFFLFVDEQVMAIETVAAASE